MYENTLPENETRNKNPISTVLWMNGILCLVNIRLMFSESSQCRTYVSYSITFKNSKYFN